MNTIELKGIDGSSPIGMLAALGALRAATRHDRSTRMGWNMDTLPFHPVLETSQTADEFSEKVCAEACRIAASVVTYGDVIKTDSEKYRHAAETHIPLSGLPGDLTDSDYFAAFACDATTENDSVKPTLLSFSNGGGMQFLLKDFRTLAQKCSAQLVMSNIVNDTPALTECTGLNWDPGSLRSYALRWSDPNTDKKQTDVPMNVLAFLGLAAIPAVPSGRMLATAGFDAKGKHWCWPIWDGSLSYGAVCSLLTAPTTAGIAYRYSARRFTDNKRLYFAPSIQQ